MEEAGGWLRKYVCTYIRSILFLGSRTNSPCLSVAASYMYACKVQSPKSMNRCDMSHVIYSSLAIFIFLVYHSLRIH